MLHDSRDSSMALGSARRTCVCPWVNDNGAGGSSRSCHSAGARTRTLWNSFRTPRHTTSRSCEAFGIVRAASGPAVKLRSAVQQALTEPGVSVVRGKSASARTQRRDSR